MQLQFDFDLILLVRIFGLLIAADFILGVVAAAKERRLKSRICSDGMFRSIGELAVLGIFSIINLIIPGIHDYLVMFMVGFIIKELLSICENLQRLDVWLPNFILNLLPEVVNKIDSGELTIKKK
ncbi:phage holin family protein [Romboutsia timonensis]|uniref:phage holin family protein n=1 Tax=Romboutsia timonensis TaxID=1776391 RepID=UPI002A8281E1|nr:phage holin family protein [Romboutsia timonensis]MDY3960160.1 phage holin family protein [Romboutsia timonensis]